jgi:hypothetical protein
MHRALLCLLRKTIHSLSHTRLYCVLKSFQSVLHTFIGNQTYVRVSVPNTNMVASWTHLVGATLLPFNVRFWHFCEGIIFCIGCKKNMAPARNIFTFMEIISDPMQLCMRNVFLDISYKYSYKLYMKHFLKLNTANMEKVLLPNSTSL